MTTAATDAHVSINQIWTTFVQAAVETGVTLSRVVSDPEKLVRLSRVRIGSFMVIYRPHRKALAFQRVLGLCVVPCIALGLIATFTEHAHEGGWLVPLGFGIWWGWGRLDRHISAAS